jgi:hypothetical protein
MTANTKATATNSKAPQTKGETMAQATETTVNLSNFNFADLLKKAEETIQAGQKGNRSEANNGETIPTVPVPHKLETLEGMEIKPLATRKGYYQRFGCKQKATAPTRKTAGNSAGLVMAALIKEGQLTAAMVHEIAAQVSTEKKTYDPSYLLELVSRFTGNSIRMDDAGNFTFAADTKGKRGASTYTLAPIQ